MRAIWIIARQLEVWPCCERKD